MKAEQCTYVLHPLCKLSDILLLEVDSLLFAGCAYTKVRRPCSWVTKGHQSRRGGIDTQETDVETDSPGEAVCRCTLARPSLESLIAENLETGLLWHPQ